MLRGLSIDLGKFIVGGVIEASRLSTKEGEESSCKLQKKWLVEEVEDCKLALRGRDLGIFVVFFLILLFTGLLCFWLGWSVRGIVVGKLACKSRSKECRELVLKGKPLPEEGLRQVQLPLVQLKPSSDDTPAEVVAARQRARSLSGR